MMSLKTLLGCGAAALAAFQATGQVVLSSDLDSATGFTVVGDADTLATFGYDYSADGIPSAPGGTGTVGLKLEANITGGVGAEIAAVSTAIAAPVYNVSVDLWVNANGPFPGGGGGSTEFGGVGIGHDGTTAGRNGGSLIYTGEGGSSRDYRLYKDAAEQFIASGQYGPASNNNSDPAFVAAFPAVAPPASQGQTGLVNDGVGGFQWMTLQVAVDTAASTATYQLTSADSGSTVVIGTLNGNLGSSFSTAGGVSLVYADLFDSLSDNSALSFGVYDNLVVTAVPEPASLALLSLGGLAVLAGRRKA